MARAPISSAVALAGTLWAADDARTAYSPRAGAPVADRLAAGRPIVGRLVVGRAIAGHWGEIRQAGRRRQALGAVVLLAFLDGC